MFYPNTYDTYMQDLLFFNQNPNIVNNFQNNSFANPNQTMNLSSYFPSLYKILIPVIVRVVQNSNYQYLNEEVINSMTDTVYNIVEGEILEDNSSSSNNSQSNNQNNNNIQNSSSNNSNSSNNQLLKDIIKILVIKELQNRQIRQINQNLYYQF